MLDLATEETSLGPKVAHQVHLIQSYLRDTFPMSLIITTKFTSQLKCKLLKKSFFCVMVLRKIKLGFIVNDYRESNDSHTNSYGDFVYCFENKSRGTK